MKNKLKKLLAIRKMCVEAGDVYTLQKVNGEIAEIAAKLHLDYYTL